MISDQLDKYAHCVVDLGGIEETVGEEQSIVRASEIASATNRLNSAR